MAFLSVTFSPEFLAGSIPFGTGFYKGAVANDEEGNPVLDLAHVIETLNKLEIGSPEKILLGVCCNLPVKNLTLLTINANSSES